MALWMEAGSQPTTEKELADIEAIQAIKESAALELKEKGNEFVKMGKKHYSDAIDCYTRAINQNALTGSEASAVFANRAHVNLLLGNYRRALTDAQESIKLSSTNVKAYYRAVKAALALGLLSDAMSYCEKGIEHDPSNGEMKKLLKNIELKKSESERHKLQVAKAVEEAELLVSAFESRGYKIGKAAYQELTGLRKPVLDKSDILHWPVLLLYAEVMSSDFIEDFCETDMFSDHLDIMFSESSPPLPWDANHHYTREAIELYYEAGSGVELEKKNLMPYLLQGTVASNLEDFTSDEKNDSKISEHTLPEGLF
uniref:Cns1/TTC4 wheel domain-containing protein n=1 Tax=Kalanchoe fedtschenkoi TaxID=63787 RepID=A0A7N0U9X3_KALFE